MPRYVALLRAIAHVPMQPFREAIEGLGCSDVSSFGMSGNLLFSSPIDDAAQLERAVADAVGAVTFIRTAAEIRRVAGGNPYAGRPGAAVLFIARAARASERRRLLSLEYAGEPPVILGRSVCFVHPLRHPGRRSTVDVERVLGIAGTARAATVVERIHARL